MISFDDPRWDDLEGGYRIEYDPRPALLALEADPNDPEAWAELWEELHHQGDVGEASDALVQRAVLAVFAIPGRMRGWGRGGVRHRVSSEARVWISSRKS